MSRVVVRPGSLVEVSACRLIVEGGGRHHRRRLPSPQSGQAQRPRRAPIRMTRTHGEGSLASLSAVVQLALRGRRSALRTRVASSTGGARCVRRTVVLWRVHRGRMSSPPELFATAGNARVLGGGHGQAGCRQNVRVERGCRGDPVPERGSCARQGRRHRLSCGRAVPGRRHSPRACDSLSSEGGRQLGVAVSAQVRARAIEGTRVRCGGRLPDPGRRVGRRLFPTLVVTVYMLAAS